MELNRKEKILKLIIEDFVKNAKPVGSSYLVEAYKLPYASATVRNEMAELEKDGLIEKPHTSGGRVPTSAGYKYYVENLRNEKIDEKYKNKIQSIFSSSKSLEEVISETCNILSSITNLTSVVIGPNSDAETLANIQIVPLTEKSCSAIFVTDKGYVENKTFILNDNVSMKDVKDCMEMLNKRLVGTKVCDLVEKLENLKPIFKDYVVNYDYLFATLIKTFYEIAKERSTFYGKENLLTQPEFKDNASELKKIFGLFNNPNDLEKILEEAESRLLLNAGDVEERYNDVSIVSKDIAVDGEKIGKIAVIGPTRMDYSNVLNSLDYIVNKIMEHLSNEDIQDEKGGKNGRE